MDWRSLALWLADCHAATAEYDGRLRSTSKWRRRRLANICSEAQAQIATGVIHVQPRKTADVLKRLECAANDLEKAQ